MNTSFGPTFENIQRLRQWLSKNGLIADINTPLFEWVDGESKDSSNSPSKGILLINSDCYPSGKDCIDIINNALNVLKEQQTTIEEIQYRRCNKNEAFFFAKWGISENKCLTIKDNTLEELKSKKFIIEVKQENNEQKYKLEVTVKDKNDKTIKLSYALNMEDSAMKFVEDKIDLNGIKNEIESMLSNPCIIVPEKKTLSNRQNNKRILILKKILCTGFMEAFYQIPNKKTQKYLTNSNVKMKKSSKTPSFLINPFAEIMKNCLLQYKKDKHTSTPEDCQQLLLDNNIGEDIWLIRMSKYLKELSLLIEDTTIQYHWWATAKELDNRRSISFAQLMKNILTVKGFIETCNKKSKEDSNDPEQAIKSSLEKLNERIYHTRPKKNIHEIVIDEKVLNSIKKELTNFIVKNKEIWDKILIYRAISLHEKGSFNLRTFNETEAKAYLSDWYIYNKLTEKQPSKPLFENASSI